MIDKIVALFATDEEVNHDLAVELMKGQEISLVDVFEHTPIFVSNNSRITYNPIYISEGNVVGEDVIYEMIPNSLIDHIMSWARTKERILKAKEVNDWVVKYLKGI